MSETAQSGDAMVMLTEFVKLKNVEEQVFRTVAHLNALAKEKTRWAASLALYEFDLDV